jgi:hypothetical protein
MDIRSFLNDNHLLLRDISRHQLGLHLRAIRFGRVGSHVYTSAVYYLVWKF